MEFQELENRSLRGCQGEIYIVPGLCLLFLSISCPPGGELVYHMLSHDEASRQAHSNGAN